MHLENSEAEKTEHSTNSNPFAADEDDDSDEDKDFTVGDLEVEEEGKGHLPPGTSLVANEVPLLDDDAAHDKNVGIHHLASDVQAGRWNVSGAGSGGRAQATFPSLWPFGGNVGESQYHRNHFRGASADDDELQSSDDSDSDEENEVFRGHGTGKRRLSVATEAKRRTSIEDDDEEVVHVSMAEQHMGKDHGESRAEGGEDDGELVEIQHAEMHGVEEVK